MPKRDELDFAQIRTFLSRFPAGTAAPTIYNTDHYTVVERLTEHPDYPDILKRTKVEDTKALQQTLNSWVWIIGPERDPTNHWAEEIPEYIKNAAKKP